MIQDSFFGPPVVGGGLDYLCKEQGSFLAWIDWRPRRGLAKNPKRSESISRCKAGLYEDRTVLDNRNPTVDGDLQDHPV